MYKRSDDMSDIRDILQIIMQNKQEKTSLELLVKDIVYNMQAIGKVSHVLICFTEPLLKAFSVNIGSSDFQSQINPHFITRNLLIRTHNRLKDIGNIVLIFEEKPSKIIGGWVESMIKSIETAAESEVMKENLNQYQHASINFFARLIREKDQMTYEHCYNVSMLTGFLCKIMQLPPLEIEITTQAALLHDVGKISIQSNILHKPEKLTNEEYEMMKNHPIYGYELLSKNPDFTEHAAIVRQHHERYDGTGYPDQLLGESIMLSARILAIADTFDAMIRIRPYRKAPADLSDIVSELRRCAGSQFDPIISEKFANILEKREFFIFPTLNEKTSV